MTILEEQPVWGEDELDEGYRALAEDRVRETEGLELSEASIGDASDQSGKLVSQQSQVDEDCETDSRAMF